MSFDVAADAYDRYMGAWSSLLAPQMADLAGVQVDQRVLDVGCGPGSLVATLVARAGTDGVAAVDPSETFVDAVRHRHPGVVVDQASAESLPHRGGVFDAALAQLVVHFMSDPVAGLREMARVTKPGGVVVACVWDFDGHRGPLGPFWEVARTLDPSVVDESQLPGARRGHLAALLTAAGLGDLRQAELGAHRRFAGFDDWWAPFTRGVGPGGAYVAALADDQRNQLKDGCRSMLPSGSFVVAAAAWAVRGTVER